MKKPDAPFAPQAGDNKGMDPVQEALLRKVQSLESHNQELQARLAEAEEALRAISTGEVDALVVYGDEGERIYTLHGADYAYRVMVESIHEGAANIAVDGTILYCNKCLSDMLEAPLERVLGSTFISYLAPDQHESFAALVRKGLEQNGRAEFNLAGYQGSPTPALISASAAEVDGRRGVCLVVTDLTEQKQAMARERELQSRLMEQREEERVRIARNLHDGPLQELIGLSYMIQGLKGDSDLAAVRGRIVALAGELRGVCNELRPPSTMRFGLAKAILYHSQEIQFQYPGLTIRTELPPEGVVVSKELSNALFRIFQECMNNVIRHSGATTVEVRLLVDPVSALLEVQDNGGGFHSPQDWVELARRGHLGLVGMRERAESLGGKLRILSAPGRGTTIQVEAPVG
jgi:PAS domain S-box-containing protein